MQALAPACSTPFAEAEALFVELIDHLHSEVAHGMTHSDLEWELEEMPHNGAKVSLKVARRMRQVEKLPTHEQAALLKTIDAFLRAGHLD